LVSENHILLVEYFYELFHFQYVFPLSCSCIGSRWLPISLLYLSCMIWLNISCAYAISKKYLWAKDSFLALAFVLFNVRYSNDCSFLSSIMQISLSYFFYHNNSTQLILYGWRDNWKKCWHYIFPWGVFLLEKHSKFDHIEMFY
jgi:hypothetical protein